MGRIHGDLLPRTLAFGKGILVIVDGLPNNVKGWEIGRQLIKSGTSIGANLREADHALTEPDFAHQCNIARKEAAETHDWLELCRDCRLLNGDKVQDLLREADEPSRSLGAVKNTRSKKP